MTNPTGARLQRGEALKDLRERLDEAGLLEREDRELLEQVEGAMRPLDASTGELMITTLVSHRTGGGRVNMAWGGAHVEQFDVAKAREIAAMLFEAAASAEAEAMLLRFLIERAGLAQARAAQMLQQFRQYREEPPAAEGKEAVDGAPV